ncbi:MAG: ATP-binding protein [Chloroflexota bacterium]
MSEKFTDHTRWDDPHLKALLRMRRFPPRLIQAEPWRSWLEARGGPKAVVEKLLASDLSPAQRSLLEIIWLNPEEAAEFYAFRLSLSQSAYFVHLRTLVAHLTHYLNRWSEAPGNGPMAQARRARVPVPLTSVIGIEQSVAQVVALLRSEARLVSVIGPGGIGKTRLAIQVGRVFLAANADFRHGVVFVSLAAAGQADEVACVIAQALDIEGSSGQPVDVQLRNFLSQQDLLLVLDNFEHVSEAALLVSELLSAAPCLKILVTSRQVLHVYGEYQFCLPPLSLPPPDSLPPLNALPDYAAIRLFLERARMVRPEFILTEENAAAVVDICTHLDGLPLAIELAAARIKILSPQQILKQIGNHLELLEGGPLTADLRHQTLWRTLAWSYILLDETEKAAFRRLGVFAHYWTLEAAQSVTEFPHLLSTLAALMDKSLIYLPPREGAADNPGFCMLQTIRQYALAQLAACGELAMMRRRHFLYYQHLLREAETSIGSPAENLWLTRVRSELDNVRVALAWALEADPVQALDLVAHTWRFWQMLNLLSEGRRWMEQVLAKTPDEVDLNKVKALCGLGWLAASQGDFSYAAIYFDAGLQAARRLENPQAVGWLLHGVADVALHQEEFERAEALLLESHAIFAEIGDQAELAWSLDILGRVSLARKDYELAAHRLEEALDHFRQLEHAWGIAWSLDHLGQVLRAQGNDRRSQCLLEESLAYLKRFGNTWRQAWTLMMLAGVRLHQNDIDAALKLFRQSLQLHTDVKNTIGIVATLDEMIALAVTRRDDRRALTLAAAVQFNAALTGFVRPAFALPLDRLLAEVRARLGRKASAAAWRAGQAMPLDEAVALGWEMLG